MWKRILLLLVVLAGLAGLYFGGGYLHSGLMTGGGKLGAPYQSLNVKAKDLTLVCPGSAFAPAKATSASTQNFGRIGSAVVDYSSQLPSGVALRTLPLTGPAAGRGLLSDTAKQVQSMSTVSATAVTISGLADSTLQGSSLFTAQSFEVAAGGSVVGALGANCQAPSAESWLLGGVTTVGRQSLLVLSNPANTDATVSVEIIGPEGGIQGSGLNALSVSANRTVVLPLAGFAPDQAALAVHVVSTGASIASWIQQSTVRGTVAAGADLVSPSVVADRNLTIPGVLKRGTADATALIGANSDYSDLTPAVQVLVPGSKSATVTIQVVGADAKSTGTVRQEQVAAGSVTSIDLPGLGDGNYTVFVAADQPVMAQLKLSRTTKTGSPVTDFAWLPAVLATTEQTVLAAPKSAITKLSIANAGNQPAQVTVTDVTTGVTQSITVGRLGSVVVATVPGDAIGVYATQPVSTSMICDFNGQIVVIPGINQRNFGGRIHVLVR